MSVIAGEQAFCTPPAVPVAYLPIPKVSGPVRACVLSAVEI